MQTQRTNKTQDSIGECLSGSVSKSRESKRESRSRSKNRDRGTGNNSPRMQAAPRIIPELESKNNMIELINLTMFII